jgi:hypothetical protein
MNLTALAVRLCAVHALKGATFAGARVFDSQIVPIDLSKEVLPTITVAIDDGEMEIEGRDILGGDATLNLIFEIMCASTMTATIPPEEGGGVEEQVVIPHTDAGLEITLNLMGRQIDRALLTPGNGWSDLFRSFVTGFGRVVIRRGASAEKGSRFAAHQLTLPCKTIAEPSFAPIDEGSVWAAFLAKCRTVEDLEGIADLIEAEIKTPTLADWQRVASDIGLRDRGALSIGFGAATSDLLPGEAPGMTVAAVIYPGGELEITPAAIDDALVPE